MKARFLLCLALPIFLVNALVAQNEIVTSGTVSFTTGINNAGIGSSIFTTVTSGSRNTFIGNNAGNGVITNDDNTYVGFNAHGSNGLIEAAAIGADAEVTADRTIILGRPNDLSGAIPNVNVGIGITVAPAKLTVFNGTNPSLLLSSIPLDFPVTYDCPVINPFYNYYNVAGVMLTCSQDSAKAVGSISAAIFGTELCIGASNLAWGPGADLNVGVMATASGEDAAKNIGVLGDIVSDQGLINIAAAGIVDDECGTDISNGARINYGIYGQCDPANIAPPFSGIANNWAGFFSGNVNVTGVLVDASDAKLKTNVERLTSSLEKIRKMNFYSYNFKRDEFPQMNLATGKHFGVISQELEKVFPELVINTGFMETEVKGRTYPAQEYKAVNYIELIPVTMQAVQELDKKMEALNKLLAQKGIDLAVLEDAAKGVKVNNGATLEQNAPNPFTSETTIRYYAPENVSKVMLVVMNLNGEVIMKDSNLQTGKQEFKIKAGELRSGTYFYTLFCDNELVATKKMIMLN